MTAVAKSAAHYVDADINPDTLAWSCTETDATRPVQERALWYPSDFTHLEGEEVQLLVDGAVAANETVTSGAVAGDTGTVNHVGLAYTSKLQPMKMNTPAMMMRISKIYLRFYNTLGAKYGEELTALSSAIFRAQADDFGSSPDLFTGEKELGFEGAYSREGDIWVIQDQPLPVTLLGIDLNVTMDDGSN